MKAAYSIFSLSVTLAIAALAGCGGGSGSSGNGNPTINPFAGKYVGAYQNVTQGTLGNFSFTVNSTGAISGTIVVSGQTVALGGSVTSAGHAVFQPAGQSADTGTVTGAGRPTFSGTTTDSANDTIFYLAIANPQGAQAGNVLSNDYSGTVDNTTANLKGIITFSVDGSGKLTGLELLKPAATVEIATLSGTLLASGAVQYTVTANGSVFDTDSGNLALSGSTLSGTLHNSLNQSVTLDLAVNN